MRPARTRQSWFGWEYEDSLGRQVIGEGLITTDLGRSRLIGEVHLDGHGYGYNVLSRSEHYSGAGASEGIGERS